MAGAEDTGDELGAVLLAVADGVVVATEVDCGEVVAASEVDDVVVPVGCEVPRISVAERLCCPRAARSGPL